MGWVWKEKTKRQGEHVKTKNNKMLFKVEIINLSINLNVIVYVKHQSFCVFAFSLPTPDIIDF